MSVSSAVLPLPLAPQYMQLPLHPQTTRSNSTKNYSGKRQELSECSGSNKKSSIKKKKILVCQKPSIPSELSTTKMLEKKSTVDKRKYR